MSLRTASLPNCVTIDGCQGAYFTSGVPGKLPLLLMHGVGPGASVSGAFATIIRFLNEHFHVFAMDLIGFGMSGHKPLMPHFDFDLWVRQARAVIEAMPSGKIGIFGHSASGAIALRIAASDPRVAAVITTGTAGTRFDVNRHLRRLWTFPLNRQELRNSLCSLIYDRSRITESDIDSRWTILQSPSYKEYFVAMFSGDMQQLADTWVVSDQELKSIAAKYTLVHGRNDLPCPAQFTSLRLAETIKHANVVLLSDCGHAPALEQPEQVCASVRLAFAGYVNFRANSRPTRRSE